MRVKAVSTSGPRTFAQRRMVTVDVAALLGELRDRGLGLDDVALERVRGGCGRRIPSWKKAGSSCSEP